MTVLDGSRVEIAAVEEPDNEEERVETLIGATTDSIEIERDPEEASWQEHMNPYTQRREMQEEGEVTTVFLLTSTLDNLIDANLYEEDEDRGLYRPAKNVQLDALEFHIYDPHQDEVQQTYRCYGAQPVVESIEMDIQEPIDLDAAFWLQDDHGFVADGATTDATE